MAVIMPCLVQKVRFRHVALALAAGLPQATSAAHLSLEIRLSRDPQAVAFCTVQLDQSLVIMTESRGSTAAQALRWPATPDETQALLAALGALLSDDLPVTDPFSARWPRPPFVSVTWQAEMTEGSAAGQYHQPGLTLPPVLQTVVMTFLTGGPCGAALAR